MGQYLTLSSSGFGGGYPGSLMGTIAYIRQIYLDADIIKRPRPTMPKILAARSGPRYDRALEGVLDSPRVLLPATAASTSIACSALPTSSN